MEHSSISEILSKHHKKKKKKKKQHSSANSRARGLIHGEDAGMLELCFEQMVINGS